MSALELDDIQSIVLFAHVRLPFARYVHLSFDAEDARPNAWLAEARTYVKGTSTHARNDGERVHIAFTHDGLERLGLTRRELTTFPRELQQGMADKLRAHVLGDGREDDPTSEGAPASWAFGGPGTRSIHVLLMLYARTHEDVSSLRDRWVERAAVYGGTPIHEDTGELHEPHIEHFGFRDGVGQPYVTGSPRQQRAHEAAVPAGEFILGYRNAYGEHPPSPVGDDSFDIGKNGTYLVYRKLEQDTAGFWRCMVDHARREVTGSDAVVNREAIKLAARLVGRWPSGAPLVKYPDFDPGSFAATDTFGFEDDPSGLKCPLGAHIRRANPRDMFAPSPKESLASVARHRILRRGRSYGTPSTGTPLKRAEPDGESRGLVFVALNTSFRRQFEFIQQTWLHNPKFAGLYDERDPVVATVDDANRTYTIPDEPARRRVSGLPRFVTMRGGAYFFLPGRKALDWLSQRRR